MFFDLCVETTAKSLNNNPFVSKEFTLMQEIDGKHYQWSVQFKQTDNNSPDLHNDENDRGWESINNMLKRPEFISNNVEDAED